MSAETMGRAMGKNPSHPENPCVARDAGGPEGTPMLATGISKVTLTKRQMAVSVEAGRDAQRVR